MIGLITATDVFNEDVSAADERANHFASWVKTSINTLLSTSVSFSRHLASS